MYFSMVNTKYILTDELIINLQELKEKNKIKIL